MKTPRCCAEAGSANRAVNNAARIAFMHLPLRRYSTAPRVDAQYVTRTRYVSVEMPSGCTGTLNCAANAAVFSHGWEEFSVRQVQPIGSLTSTVTGVVL